MCLGSVVVSVMDSHSYDRGSSPGKGNHIYVMLCIVFSSYKRNLPPNGYYIYVKVFVCTIIQYRECAAVKSQSSHQILTPAEASLLLFYNFILTYQIANIYLPSHQSIAEVHHFPCKCNFPNEFPSHP